MCYEFIAGGLEELFRCIDFTDGELKKQKKEKRKNNTRKRKQNQKC